MLILVRVLLQLQQQARPLQGLRRCKAACHLLLQQLQKERMQTLLCLQKLLAFALQTPRVMRLALRLLHWQQSSYRGAPAHSMLRQRRRLTFQRG
jgi:hypothetical protein